MRRKLAAVLFTALSLSMLATPAVAEGDVPLSEDDGYVCVRSRPLLGDDQFCVRWS